jgi:hypothetical protein
VELKLYPQASVRQHRDLRAFVRYSIDQIERAAGSMWWTVTIAPTGVCYACEVTVERGGRITRATGDGFDAAVAGRNAFIQIEKLLRANRARVKEVARVAR